MDDRTRDAEAGGRTTNLEPAEPRVLRSGQVRIIGAQPVREGAGEGQPEPPADDLPSPPGGTDTGSSGDPTPPTPPAPPADGIELPHWTEAPTGQVPAVLSRDPEGDQAGDRLSAMPGPTWREDHSDWVAQEETFEPSMLAEADARSGSLDDSEPDPSELNDRQPWSFELDDPLFPNDEATVVLPAVGAADPSEAAGELEGETAGFPPGEAGPGGSPRDRTGERPEPTVVISGRNDPRRAPGAAAPEADDPAGPRGTTGSGTGPGAGAGTGAGTGMAAGTEAPTGAGAEVRRRPATGRRGTRHSPGLRSSGSRGGGRRAVNPPDAGPGGANGRGRAAPYAGPRRRGVDGAGGSGGVGAGAITRSAQRDREGPTGRNLPVAIATGILLGVVVLACFKLGTVASMVIVTVVVALAAVEAYAAFRQAGQHPATLLGLVATVGLLIATYDKGQQALPLVAVLLVTATVVWHLAHVEPGADPLRSLSSTVFVFSWVGIFGSYGALLLDPTLFPDRHGIAFLLGAVITVVAYDVGALAVGSRFGRHPLTSVSPHKSWEGAIGGAVVAVAIGAVVVHLIHPWTVGSALALGVVVAVVSPIGDLAESLVKRHLNLKDMSRILPGHGGILDRVDGLLFVLPATYYLVKAFRLG